MPRASLSRRLGACRSGVLTLAAAAGAAPVLLLLALISQPQDAPRAALPVTMSSSAAR